MLLNNADWVDLLKKLECQDSSFLEATPPLVFERAKGSRIWDSDGREYIDLCAGFGVLALGHNSDVQGEVFRQSIGDVSQIVHGMGDVYPSVAKIKLMNILRNILPAYLSRGALALGGGQAVEIAVKTAQLATQKYGFITFEGSYHGLDLGILPLTSRKDFKEPFQQWLPSSVLELPFACSSDEILKGIQRLESSKYGCAAIIVEPIQGRAGVRIPPAGWLQQLAAIAKSRGVLLIFDEVFTGLGRIGSVSSAFEVPCDLVCLGKALGGGLPLSACFGSSEVMDAWPKNSGEAIHTGTFFGHPLSCRLGLATIEKIIELNLIERSRLFGAQMLADLGEQLGSFNVVKDVRGVGMMIAIDLISDGLGAKWMNLLRERGIIALASGSGGCSLSLTPALNLLKEDWHESLQTLVSSLKDLH